MSGDRWTEVGAGVHVRRHESMDLNVGLVVGEGACLVVDTRESEARARDLAQAVRTVTPHPWVVVNTHHHFDHTFGNAALRPARIWGHRRCAEAMLERGEQTRRVIADRAREAGDEAAAAAYEQSRIDPPDELVDDVVTLTVGGRPVHLRHLGRGHTDNDLVVVVPDAELLLAGDLVEEGAPPQFSSAYPLDWPGTLDALLELVTGPVVPGHGAVVDRTYVEGQRDELTSLADLARIGYAEGRPATDIARDVPYFGEFAGQAAERAYDQLRALSSGRTPGTGTR